VGKIGLISADYQFVDYRDARFHPTGEFADINDIIQSSYSTQNIIRVGTEWRFGPFSVRGGYGFYSSPFNNNINDGERNQVLWELVTDQITSSLTLVLYRPNLPKNTFSTIL